MFKMGRNFSGNIKDNATKYLGTLTYCGKHTLHARNVPGSLLGNCDRQDKRSLCPSRIFSPVGQEGFCNMG